MRGKYLCPSQLIGHRTASGDPRRRFLKAPPDISPARARAFAVPLFPAAEILGLANGSRLFMRGPWFVCRSRRVRDGGLLAPTVFGAGTPLDGIRPYELAAGSRPARDLRAPLLRSGLADGQLTFAHGRAVELGDRGLSLGLSGHLDEGEAFGTAGEPVHDELDRADLAAGGEQLHQLFLRGLIREAADKQISAHDLLYPMRAEASSER